MTRLVIVVKACGNTYRLIVATHFSSQMAYTLRFVMHAKHVLDDWKDNPALSCVSSLEARMLLLSYQHCEPAREHINCCGNLSLGISSPPDS